MHPPAAADWLEVAHEPSSTEPAIDPLRRLRVGKWLFACGVAIVLTRAAALEYTQGDDFRQEAAQPIVHRESIPGTRGRILARDATVLAVDQDRPALAVRYRQLEEPPDPRWLRRQARARLNPSQRKDPSQLTEEEARIVAERRAMRERLATLCGLSPQQWRQRAAGIQQRVLRISRSVNRRNQQALLPAEDSSAGFWQRVARNLDDLLQSPELPAPIVVAEELQHHVIAEDIPLEVVAEVESHPERYPGVRIEPRRRRLYPQGDLAANLVGHLGVADAGAGERHPEDRVGRLGLELAFDAVLYGRRGTLVEHWRRTGEVVASHRQQEPGLGRDVTLTLDLALQRTAETLLARACQRRDALAETPVTGGGAVVVLDVHSGAVLAAASAPRFDPNLFAAGGQTQSAAEISRVLSDPAHPVLERTSRMALTPGSVFKPITAIALLETETVDPAEPISCRGYLHRPDAQRCAIYTRSGIGHGDVTLVDALAASCNVYFFKTVGSLGPQPLTDWAARLGLGRPTGIELRGEAAGQVPHPTADGWGQADTQALAIGQSRLTVTPLQMARVMAAVANGGLLVQPHLVNSISTTAGSPESDPSADASTPPQPIEGLSSATLALIGEGLERVVADSTGTAHESVFLPAVPIAGKTGTAETGGGLPDHAWFAGYCPAEAPKVALVVVLEHAGDGGSAAGPVARLLVERLHQLGYFQRRRPADSVQ
jgi:penicillin-binding protein 2